MSGIPSLLTVDSGDKSVEDIYFDFSLAPSAKDTPYGMNALLLPETRDWELVYSRCWRQIAAYTTATSPEEAAVRLAVTGLTIDQARRMSAKTIAARTGMRFSEACVCVLALTWEITNQMPVFGGSVGGAQLNSHHPPPTASAVTTAYLPKISPINFIHPHTSAASQSECGKTKDVSSVGSINYIKTESTYHSTIAFLTSIFLSGIAGEFRIAAGVWTKDNVPVHHQVRYGIFLAIGLLRYLSLIHSIVALISSSASQVSDYQACSYLALPGVLRFGSAPLLLLSEILNISAAISLWDINETWYFYSYLSVFVTFIAISIFYISAMYGRVYTSHRDPKHQWFRWFPIGYTYTTRQINRLLESAGNFRKFEFETKWRDDIIAGITSSIVDK